MKSTRWNACAIGITTLLSCGCATTLNEEIGLIGIDDSLPALSGGSESTVNDQPSLHGLDRTHWTNQTVAVPLRQVEHNPAFGRSIEWCANSDNGSTAFPTAESALYVESPLRFAARSAVLEFVALPGSWVAATFNTAFDEDGLFGVDRSPRAFMAFERLPEVEPESAQRLIARSAPTSEENVEGN